MALLSRQEIEYLFYSHWKPGYGSVSPGDIYILQSLIAHYKPTSFLEIGMASGLSAGFISLFLDDVGGERLVTIDHDNTFFGDPSKPNGFIVETIYRGNAVEISKLPFTLSVDLPSLQYKYEMAFIDANHQHPWPTIDLLMAYTKLTGNKIVIFDDLDLYRKQSKGIGIGPKIIYDQFSILEKNRPSQKDDLFYVDLSSIGLGQFVDRAIGALYYPWSTTKGIPEKLLERIANVIESTYGKHLSNVFRICGERYNRN